MLAGGFAGLVTAGVLGEFHDRVTVVERDPLPARGEFRRGAPWGRHAHKPVAGRRPDERGFTDFLATAAPPDVYRPVLDAEPLGAIASYRFRAAVRRHYERLRRFPDGLLVTGDALCSLNPLNAQGLSVAAPRRCLAHGRHDLSGRFFAAAAGVVAGLWQLITGADPSTTSRNPADRLQAAVMNRVTTAATRDGTVATQLGRVMSLLDPPSSLMRPTVLWHVLRPAGGDQAVTRSVPDSPGRGRTWLR